MLLAEAKPIKSKQKIEVQVEVHLTAAVSASVWLKRFLKWAENNKLKVCVRLNEFNYLMMHHYVIENLLSKPYMENWRKVVEKLNLKLIYDVWKRDFYCFLKSN